MAKSLSVQISPDRHYFQYSDGSPFFYLGDTAWMLFNKLTVDEARRLFADRASKGFTVIQSVIFRDLFEPNTPNVAGVKPFASDVDMRAVRINPKWLAYVVEITRVAAEYGLVMGLLPTWGDKWNEHSNSAGPVIMDRDSAREYCRILSDALGECENVIWILGGDSPVQTQAYADTVRAMAEGIRAGDSRERLMTFHPSGMGSSGIFHSEQWLDFNALQTSHSKVNIPNYLYIERLFNTQPAKPCLDMEPNYEMAPMFIIGKHSVQPTLSAVFSAYDVRKTLYRSVLAGAAGFTYGCEPIRQLIRPGDRIHIWDDEPMATWTEALAAPGSSQLDLLKNVLIERSYFTRMPAQELLLPLKQNPPWPDAMATGIAFAGQENTDPVAYISVARCQEGSYVMAYVPVRQVLTLDTSGVKAKRIRVSVYDPECCGCTACYETENTGMFRYMPERDMDTFVVVDAMG